MAKTRVIRKQTYKRATWKNGLGYTDEIAIFPEGSDLRKGNFLWRLSSARIENTSPFSTFPEHDRVLVVLKGNGVHLTHTFEEENEDQVEVLPLQPYEFPGDIPSRCELINGPITDLSVFVRKAEAEAIVEVVEIADGETYSWQPAGRWNFAFAIEGDFTDFSQGDTLEAILDGPLSVNETIRISSKDGDAKLLTISLQA